MELDLYIHISERLQKYVDKVLQIGLTGLFKYSTVAFYFLDFIYFISLPLGIKLTQAILSIRYQKTDLELKNTELALNNVMLELAFLKAQINPHFLFNTINNIICLVQEDPVRAEISLVQLTGIMNYLVYESDKSSVPLQSEFTFIESYIGLEKLRLNSKVQTSVQILSDKDDYFIAPVIIFAFIENAFKHGPMSSSKNAWLDIEIIAKDGKLTMQVSNGFKRVAKPVGYVGGVGLENVKKRLELNYSGNYNLDIQEMEDSYIVLLELNLKN
ncbi:sensor histidine kinase [Sphingobacterium sp. UBA6320]|uniref:sensor histidine kinase n=1 Tax=Sphingobacterium sp. UBA6320 TaxID=1947510 RepID=UPI0025D1D89F|nr:histidine kinase [Sphingobacterium sp. UBA6320]